MKITFVILLIFTTIASELQLDDLPKLPLYVGRGYDVLEGNPLSSKVDPGFEQGIFVFKYNQKKVTEDGRYAIADEVQSHLASSCLFSTKIQTYRGTQSYQSELKTKAQVSGQSKRSVVQAAFSTSTSYEEMQKVTIDQNMTLTHAMAECQAYELSVNLFNVPTFEPNFIAAVNQSYHSKNWGKFIVQFGTHFVYETIMGGRVIQEISYQSQAISKLESLNIDINIAAKASFAKFYGDASFDWNKHAEEINYVQTTAKSISELYIGGEPSRDGDIHNWVDKVKQNPMPITYKVMQISELFKKIKGIYINVAQAEKQFNAALDNYCKAKLCKIPIPDKQKPPPAYVQVQKTESYGGDGGLFFDFLQNSTTMNAVKFLMRSGAEVDQIEVLLSDGVRSVYSSKQGGEGGRAQQFQVPKGQSVSQVEYHWGGQYNALTCLVFITNKGTKSATFGICAGNYYLLTFPQDYRIIGIFGKSYGRVDRLGFYLGKTIYPIGAQPYLETIQQNQASSS